MALSDNEFARRDAQGVELRASPMRVHWRFDDLAAGDQHLLRVRFTASLTAADDPTDRRLFAEMMLSHAGTVTVEHLADHFRADLLVAARDAAKLRDAQSWIGGQHQQEMIDALHAAARKVAFSCGLIVLPPFQLEIFSPSFDQQQRLNQRVAAQTLTLQRARELLRHFEELRRTAPGNSASQILRQMPANEQSEMLAALFATTDPHAPAPLWIVSGESLLKLSADHPIPQQVTMLDSLGPLRSICTTSREANATLLIGAQRGVFQVDANSGEILRTCPAPISSDFGFNAIALAGGVIYATHVEAGLLAWQGDDAEPRVLHRAFIPAVAPAPMNSGQSMAYSQSGSRSGSRISGPRHVVPLASDAVLFAVGGKLLLAESGQVSVLDNRDVDVVALLPDRERIIVVRADGRIQAVDAFSRNVTDLQHLRRGIRAAGATPWMGSIRLLLADDSGAVDCVGLEDSAIVRFPSSHVDLRTISGSVGRIAAVASDRQRILLWSIAAPQSPAREIHVSSITRHRVAAIAFGA